MKAFQCSSMRKKRKNISLKWWKNFCFVAFSSGLNIWCGVKGELKRETIDECEESTKKKASPCARKLLGICLSSWILLENEPEQSYQGEILARLHKMILKDQEYQTSSLKVEKIPVKTVAKAFSVKCFEKTSEEKSSENLISMITFPSWY